MDTTVPADEDKDYQVVVDADGRVVVQARPVEVEAIADEKDKDKDRAIKSEVVQQKKRTRDPGEEYRSKKAGGDVWRRGQLEPHAYIPLDPKMLSKKNSGAVLAQFGSVLANRNGFKKQSQRKSRGPVGNRKQRIATRKHSAGKR
jgi:ribosomal RNA-processing protein 12